jgi:hypothetical protein
MNLVGCDTNDRSYTVNKYSTTRSHYTIDFVQLLNLNKVSSVVECLIPNIISM